MTDNSTYSINRRKLLKMGAGVGAALMASRISFAKEYGPEVSDTEIKLGQTVGYSVPASAYA